MKKKVGILLAIVMIFSTLPLSGCQPTTYNFSSVESYWSDIATSSSSDLSVKAEVAMTSGQTPEDDHGYDGQAVMLTGEDYITYSVELEEADRLAISVDYYILHNGLSDSELSISVNGTTVSERSPLKALWRNETDDFSTDSYGNEIVPSQQKIEEWESEYLYEFDYATVLPPVYDFNAGVNTITFSVNAGAEVLIGDVYLRSIQLPESYSDYIADYSNEPFGTGSYTTEAELVYSKNTISAVPTYNAAVNVTPYDTYASLLNTISGFDSPEQILTYSVTAPSDGLYNLSLNYLNENPNRTAYVQVFVDGQTPFRELLRYPLIENGQYESTTFSGEEGKFAIYLTAGEHLVSIKIDGSLTANSQTMLSSVIDDLNGIYLDLRQIAGTVSDGNREWDVENDFPGVVERLETIMDDIGYIMSDLTAVNGAAVNYQALIYLQTAQQAIAGLLDSPQYIPNKYAQLSEGSGSIVQTLANALTDIQTTAVGLDKVVIHPADANSGIPEANGWTEFVEGVKKFFHSFFVDYSNVTDDENTIQVWVARSRQYVDLMQQMIDASDFEERTGYKVRFSLLADEGKLILSNAAGIAPDAVMGISNWLPYEMGIRDLTVDLTQFEDYGEVIDRFSTGAMISLIADGIGLALPETQDFYVTYYRKDILDRYGLTVPDTWDEVIEILPTLQRYGLNYYIPLSTSTSSKSIMTTAPFIYQFGGNLFSDDGTRTTISDEGSLEAIRFMTELYTLYGLPQQVSNFFDSFRSGNLPIGISTFETYIRLSMAAPEISGRWAIALSPGMYDEERGEVVRWQTGSATAMTLIKSGSDAKDAAGWELLKWWSSEDVQTEYMNRLTMIYGKNYIWNSANLGAFNNSVAFTAADKEIILEQWEWMREIPKVPGWYMLERELSNAWNSIVIDGENTRSVVEDAVTVIDKELQRKLTEFGYIENGRVVIPYQVTTLEYIEDLKRR
ncbi:MAG TPA: extracellular solute-binding protein [Candidatus Coproplasma excrementipullorum]|nr:extracellular solute-binding protein [Candidatus Coproplasma excrementipullorum]